MTHAFSLFLANKITADEVAQVLSQFRQQPDPYGYGWIVEVAPERVVAVEIGEENGNYRAMPDEMMRGVCKLLGLRWGRKPPSRIIFMFSDEDDLARNAVWHISQAFARRSPCVLDDHASGRWLIPAS